MTRNRLRMLLLATGVAVLWAPARPIAQSTTFSVEFNRVGPPAPDSVPVSTYDPLTGLTVTVMADAGAFVNPCTMENVNVTGTSTITTMTTTDAKGNRRMSIGMVTRGTGVGWVQALGEPSFSGKTYSFSESQQFNFRLPLDRTEEFFSDFQDKLQMKGTGSIDNWIVRVHYILKVKFDGTILVQLVQQTEDPTCRG